MALQVYGTFRPTGFDAAGLGSETHGIGAFLMAPVQQTRDSGTLDRSNFRACLKALGGESDTVQVHRFGHWGPGWYELILIDPADLRAVGIAEDIAAGLEDYPVIDEEDWGELQSEYAADYWRGLSVSERLNMITAANDRTSDEWRISIFAARRDEIPEDPAGRLWEDLTQEC